MALLSFIVNIEKTDQVSSVVLSNLANKDIERYHQLIQSYFSTGSPTQSAFTCLKPMIETPEKCAKSVQS